MYKLYRNPIDNQVQAVQKLQEGWVISIPFDPANTDYQEYLEWLAEGNEPEPADDPAQE